MRRIAVLALAAALAGGQAWAQVPDPLPATPGTASEPRLTDFEARIPVAPSLRDATSFTVDGDWSLGADVTVTGDVHLRDDGSEQRVPDRARLLG